AARHSTWPGLDETRGAPWASSAEGTSNNATTIRTFLISPLLQIRQAPYEASWAVANRCGENPEPPGTNQTRCQDPAGDEFSGILSTDQRFEIFVRVLPASETLPTNEPFFRSSFPHSQRMPKNYAEPLPGSSGRNFFQ